MSKGAESEASAAAAQPATKPTNLGNQVPILFGAMALISFFSFLNSA